MHANDEDFARIVSSTPLVSIDLLVRNAQGQVLLGYRRNRPARHTWFVPGGRILKGETLEAAWHRIAATELGLTLPEPRLFGVYQHFYDDNALDIPDVGTHYVVIACEARFPGNADLHPDRQHTTLRWWDVSALVADRAVHDHTKAYFTGAPRAFGVR